MSEIWRDYVARLARRYRVTLDDCHREGMTDEGEAIVAKMLTRDIDGVLHFVFLPTQDLDSVVLEYHKQMISEALRIPYPH